MFDYKSIFSNPQFVPMLKANSPFQHNKLLYESADHTKILKVMIYAADQVGGARHAYDIMRNAFKRIGDQPYCCRLYDMGVYDEDNVVYVLTKKYMELDRHRPTYRPYTAEYLYRQQRLLEYTDIMFDCWCRQLYLPDTMFPNRNIMVDENDKLILIDFDCGYDDTVDQLGTTFSQYMWVQRLTPEDRNLIDSVFRASRGCDMLSYYSTML